MDIKDRSIIVIGTGAVGGIIAAAFSRAGYNIETVCKHEDYVDIASSRGLKVSSKKEKYTQVVRAYARIEEVKNKRDIIFLAVKATDLEDIAKRMKHVLSEESLVVAMQNGIVEYELGNIVGKHRLVSCIVGWGATMNEPGNLEMTSTGEFIIGSFDKTCEGRLGEIATLLEEVAPVNISSNIIGDRYSKLIVNSCITSLGAVSGLYLRDMLNRRKARLLFIEIINEAMELAYVMRINVEPFAGKLNFYEFLRKKGWMATLKRHTTIRLMGFRFRRLKSSSLQSLQKGRVTEIDYLNGFIASNGKELGVPVPVNSEITRMIHEIEEGKRKITPHNFDDKVFDNYYH
ncbi:MAG TPA: ketopantoate reductase family protein [Bacteroidales bacterium]|nr:ketopantoate reductase family protein [Bacteroidales bacterium]